jgi:Flp pilus assembly protein TadB
MRGLQRRPSTVIVEDPLTGERIATTPDEAVRLLRQLERRPGRLALVAVVSAWAVVVLVIVGLGLPALVLVMGVRTAVLLGAMVAEVWRR